MPGPTFSPQHDIDAAAQRYLAECLAGNWVLRRHAPPDVFLDYHLEHRAQGEPTGRTSFIQLKGQAVLKADADCAKVAMATKHLLHYAGKVTEPVFVVLVDTEKRRAFYLFTQRWLDDTQFAKTCGSMRKTTVRIPLANEFENYPAFLAAFNGAIAYMRDKYPGSPEAAVKVLERTYAELDSRFEVKVQASSHGKELRVFARSPVSIQFHLESLDGRSPVPAITSAIEYGQPFKLTNIKVTAEGSALWTHLFSAGKKMELSWGPDEVFQSTLRITPVGSAFSSALDLPAEVTRGRKGIALKTLALDCPFRMVLRLGLGSASNLWQCVLNISSDPNTWAGKPLLGAPWFPGVVSVAEAIYRGAGVQLTIIHKGIESVVGKPVRLGTSDPKDMRWGWYCLLASAAAAARRFGLNPTIPDSFTEEQQWRIEQAHQLSKDGRWLQRTLGFTIVETNEATLAVMNKIRTEGQVRGVFKAGIPTVISVFGKKKEIGILELAPVDSILTLLEDLGAKPGAAEVDRYAVRLVAADGTDLALCLPTASDGDSSTGYFEMLK